MIRLALLIYLFVIVRCSTAADDLVINLPSGSIRGHTTVSPAKKTIYAFEGIPFGQAPVGALRFQAPVEIAKWSGIKNATIAGPSCYAVGKDYPFESEDCLNLDVYTPVLDSSSSLPVMVYLFGGGFRGGTWGTSVYGPDYLVEQDVIVVGLNYRTGPLGFLSTGDLVVPGNAGLKDQVLALKWVQTNIKYFGGDPSKVTIFGQSAGGASVGWQIISKSSSGLFRGGIAESGSAVSVWAYISNPKDYVTELISKIDSTKNFTTSEEMLKYLQGIPAKDLHEASGKTVVIGHPLPVIEPQHDGAFLTENMYELVERGDINRVPLMIGGNSEEYISVAADTNDLNRRCASMDSSSKKLVPSSFHITNQTELLEVGDEIKKIYLQEGATFQENPGLAIAYMSESHFFNPCLKHAELQSKYTDVYFYKFSYAGKMGENLGIKLPGAEMCTHGEENYYIFRRKHGDYDNSDLSKFSESDVKTHQRMVAFWTNFAKYLNPTPSITELFQNLTWPKVQPGNVQYMNVDTDLKIANHIKGGRYEAWTTVFNKYAKPPLTTF